MHRLPVPLALALALCATHAPLPAHGYPLDQWKETGINRLEAYRLASKLADFLPPGAMYKAKKIKLRLLGLPPYELGTPDADFSRQLEDLLGPDAPYYGITLLDLTDPENPRYAAHNPLQMQNPGSVGKIVVALAWFQALADVYPDRDDRKRLLKDTVITANGFIHKDSHDVPIWHPGDEFVVARPLEEGDTGNLYTFFDWMCSASSNAAASVLMSHLMLLKHFGEEYPVSEETARDFFANTPKRELTALWTEAIQGPVRRNGLDLKQLRQGSFFTREGKRRVPGTSSYATSRELMHFMLLMEQGSLVDEWSSLEIKRLLYLTDRRIRYGASPALADSALVFKSGSLYSCRPESGFTCEKYRGNKANYMNSMVGVETLEGDKLHYMVVVLSNVLKKNSAVEHQELATRIHRMLQHYHHPEATAEE